MENNFTGSSGIEGGMYVGSGLGQGLESSSF